MNVRTTITLFLVAGLRLFAQDTIAHGAQIHFYNSEVIDTITLAEIDTNLMIRSTSTKYTFYFTNTGDDSLVTQFWYDANWTCDFTKGPIAPGGKGFVTICPWSGGNYPGDIGHEWNFAIRDNSVVKQFIHIKIVNGVPDSLMKVLLARKAERDVRAAAKTGPQIYFEHAEIIDEITMDELDSNFQVKGDNKYVFHFTNIGREPLIVGFTSGSDPDFNCQYSGEPIRPGGSGTITICAWQGRLIMNKHYTINDNSVLHQTIHIQRTFDYNDSTYLLLQKRRAEQNLAKQKYGNRNMVSVKRDSLPELLRTNINVNSWPVITFDTSLYIFCVYSPFVSTGSSNYLAPKTDRPNCPPGTAFMYGDSTQYVYYDVKGHILERWFCESKVAHRKNRKHKQPYTRITWSITIYSNEQVVRKYTKLVDVPRKNH